MALWTQKKITVIVPAELEKVPPFVLLILQFNIPFNPHLFQSWGVQSTSPWLPPAPCCSACQMPSLAPTASCCSYRWFSIKQTLFFGSANTNLQLMSTWVLFFTESVRTLQSQENEACTSCPINPTLLDFSNIEWVRWCKIGWCQISWPERPCWELLLLLCLPLLWSHVSLASHDLTVPLALQILYVYGWQLTS